MTEDAKIDARLTQLEKLVEELARSIAITVGLFGALFLYVVSASDISPDWLRAAMSIFGGAVAWLASYQAAKKYRST
jgi:hypothetical protein